jgi:hypothetical protein
MPLKITPARPALPDVTLCAATSVNIAATLRALEASLAQLDFAACLLFTDAAVTPPHPAIRVVPIARLHSAEAYSEFLLDGLVDHIDTSHCLVMQWDGHVLDARRWEPAFLDYDYIGASWPQFDDGHDVGNGGFSLRSRQILQAYKSAGFKASHPEDIMIARQNRTKLESLGIRFAPRAVADRFSAERAGDPSTSFGYHGVWHMPHLFGVQAFWQIYGTLDERSTIRHDFSALLKQLVRGRGGYGRAIQLIVDRMRDAMRRG